jgi:MprA protease rhombosortase-interaction domain-containing protein
MRSAAVGRLLALTAGLFALLFCSAPFAQADTITFDGPISQPAGAPAPVDLGFALDYETPDDPGVPPEAFYTQGFAFGGRTAGVVDPAPTKPGFGIVYDPAVCTPFGTDCVDNGTQTLAFDVAASMTREDFGLFSIASFSASQAYSDPASCVDCGEFGLQNAEFLRVFGFNAGTLLVQQTFELDYGFETYLLLGSGWSALDRVVFQPLNGAGAPGMSGIPDAPDADSCCTAVLDNIEVDATSTVPEPAAVLLLASGLVGFAVRRRVFGISAKSDQP